jgi:hypothetical protein
VRGFLDRHADRLAARVRRETNTKLVTGTKNKPKNIRGVTRKDIGRAER